jgi:hypothetical protein
MIIPKNNDPYVAPKKYFDMYPTEGVVLPSERVDDWDNKPRAAKGTNPLHFGLNKEKQQKALRAYYASISFMDSQVGRLLEARDQLKLADNTLCCYFYQSFRPFQFLVFTRIIGCNRADYQLKLFLRSARWHDGCGGRTGIPCEHLPKQRALKL